MKKRKNREKGLVKNELKKTKKLNFSKPKKRKEPPDPWKILRSKIVPVAWGKP